MSTTLTTKQIIAQMKAALPKEARVWKRLFTDGYVIQNGWFGDYAILRSSGWYYCFHFGTLTITHDCSFHGRWYCYGGGTADHVRLAWLAWERLRKHT